MWISLVFCYSFAFIFYSTTRHIFWIFLFLINDIKLLDVFVAVLQPLLMRGQFSTLYPPSLWQT